MKDKPNYSWRDLGDGVPVRVERCPKCGVAPAAVDDCGMPTPTCPYFGVDRPVRDTAWREAMKEDA